MNPCSVPLRLLRIAKICGKAVNPYLVKRLLDDPIWPFLTIASHWKLMSSVINLGQTEFLVRMTGQQMDQVDIYLSEIRQNTSFYEHLTYTRQVHCPDGLNTGGIEYTEGEVLYALVRILQPRVAIETGVAEGVSSAFFLQALEDNGDGQLYSIDLPPSGAHLADSWVYYMPTGETSGWVIPRNLTHRWHLILGDFTSELPSLLDTLGEIDMFLHDSLHTRKHKIFEYETAWPFIKSNGLLLSNDLSTAFVQFCRRVDRLPLHYRDLGGIRKV